MPLKRETFEIRNCQGLDYWSGTCTLDTLCLSPGVDISQLASIKHHLRLKGMLAMRRYTIYVDTCLEAQVAYFLAQAAVRWQFLFVVIPLSTSGNFFQLLKW